MAIYLLERINGYVGYDEFAAKVVVARCEDEARKIANIETGDEGQLWTDPKQVHCELVDTQSIARVVLSDFRSG